ncbi:MAG: M20/M25/M40 family metallo-hydrolase [Gemmatimonadetes bacterium]|nr:M20/M25/M40 family metallo-hydrolase [Gemmatimonadota bacterium]
MTDLPFLELFRQLLPIPCPSGREERMAGFLAGQIEALGASPQSDRQGNLWVEVPGTDPGPGIALASHMDEIGMVVTAIEDDGTLRVQRSGGLYPWKMGEGPVTLVGAGDQLVPAHLSFGSGHTNDPADPIHQFATGRRGITWRDTRLLTGLTPSQLQDAGVRAGTCAVPAADRRGPSIFGPSADPLVSAWLFDNRGGSLVLIELLRRLLAESITPSHTLHLCFMVQEEGGLLGAKGWASRHEVETFIAVDSTPMPAETRLALDGRPATWSKDRGAHFHQGLIAELDAAATHAGTELQYAVYTAAASDATGVLEIGAAPRCATIGYPRENSHGYEVVRWSVFGHLINTLFEYVTRV